MKYLNKQNASDQHSGTLPSSQQPASLSSHPSTAESESPLADTIRTINQICSAKTSGATSSIDRERFILVPGGDGYKVNRATVKSSKCLSNHLTSDCSREIQANGLESLARYLLTLIARTTAKSSSQSQETSTTTTIATSIGALQSTKTRLSENNPSTITSTIANQASGFHEEEEEEDRPDSEDDDWVLLDKTSTALTATTTTTTTATTSINKTTTNIHTNTSKGTCPVGGWQNNAAQRSRQMALDKTDVELIKASWIPAKKDPVAAGLLLFKGLFTKFPQYLKFFSQFSDLDIERMHENKRLIAHAVKVIDTVTFVVDSIGDESKTDVLNEALLNLVKGHLKKKVGLAEFRNLGIVLIDFICDLNHRRSPGGVSMSDGQALVAAWTKLYSGILDLVKREEEQQVSK